MDALRSSTLPIACEWRENTTMTFCESETKIIERGRCGVFCKFCKFRVFHSECEFRKPCLHNTGLLWFTCLFLLSHKREYFGAHQFSSTRFTIYIQKINIDSIDISRRTSRRKQINHWRFTNFNSAISIFCRLAVDEAQHPVAPQQICKSEWHGCSLDAKISRSQSILLIFLQQCDVVGLYHISDWVWLARHSLYSQYHLARHWIDLTDLDGLWFRGGP